MINRNVAMKLKYFIALMIVAVVSSSTYCDEPVPTVRFHVKNKCNEAIHVDIYGYSTNASDPNFEDWPYITGSSSCCVVGPFKSNHVDVEMYDQQRDNERYYRFVVLKQSTLDRYSGKIDELLEKNIYDSVFVYSLAELKAMNYRITYSED